MTMPNKKASKTVRVKRRKKNSWVNVVLWGNKIHLVSAYNQWFVIDAPRPPKLPSLPKPR